MDNSIYFELAFLYKVRLLHGLKYVYDKTCWLLLILSFVSHVSLGARMFILDKQCFISIENAVQYGKRKIYLFSQPAILLNKTQMETL